jgi:hypothetical protein
MVMNLVLQTLHQGRRVHCIGFNEIIYKLFWCYLLLLLQ